MWVSSHSNVLLRFFTVGPPLLFQAAKALIESAERGAVILDVPTLVVAETAFTLESYYKHSRREVAGVFIEFFNIAGIRLPERDLVLNALGRVQATGVRFVDAYLAAVAKEVSIPVASFDRNFDRFKDVERIEPRA
jgi:predicted nucleic acid-binding protein